MSARFCPTCGQPAGQLSLAPADPSTKTRSSDPDTSKAAAKLAFPKAGKQRHTVLLTIAGSDHGLTADAVAHATGIPYVSVSTRISELKAGGWLYPTGQHAATEAGRMAEVVDVTDRAREKIGSLAVAA